MDIPTAWQLIDLGRETRSLEYKSSMHWGQPETKAKLVRSALAMSNTPDGGSIIFGVTDATFVPDGMSQPDYDSLQPDEISVEVNEFADPRVAVETLKLERDGRLFVVVDIAPFDIAPTICRRDGGPPGEPLHAGAIYVRPIGKPETRRVRNSQEMRELLDRATEITLQRARRFVAAAKRSDDESQARLDSEMGAFR